MIKRAEYSTRPPYGRMMRILERLQAGGADLPNCSSLAAELEVSVKTVQRDLDYLRDQLQVPLHYDRQRHGYHLTGPLPPVLAPDLGEGELLALFLATRVAEPLRGTRFGEALERAVNRFLLHADDAIDLSLAELQEGLTISPGPQVEGAAEGFETLREAMKKGRVVEFAYRGLKDTRARKRRVQPWHVGWLNGGWYLFGYDEGRKAERTFLVGRMRSVEVSERTFQRPEGYSLGGRLRGSFGVFGVGRDRLQKVRLRFDAFAAQLVRERRWHESQEITEEVDGGLVLTLKLSSLEEVERWVLSWGTHVEVLGPVKLRRRLAQVGAFLGECYE